MLKDPSSVILTPFSTQQSTESIPCGNEALRMFGAYAIGINKSIGLCLKCKINGCLHMTGEVAETKALSAEDFAAFPAVRQRRQSHCSICSTRPYASVI